jgi:hypothetical protein
LNGTFSLFQASGLKRRSRSDCRRSRRSRSRWGNPKYFFQGQKKVPGGTESPGMIQTIVCNSSCYPLYRWQRGLCINFV